MTLDEAIAQAREKADKNSGCWKHCLSIIPCKKCEQEHEQLAEWLEELKTYRENSCQQCDYGECHKYHEKSLLEFFLTKENEIKNRTIDNFCAEIKKEYDNDYCPNVSDYLDYKISLRDLFNIAEQLKEGGKNE